MKNAPSIAAMLLVLTACGPWPQIDLPHADTSGVWPSLVPLEDITGAPSAQSSQSEARALSARAADLRTRARIMRQAVPDQDAFETLRARLER